MYASSQCSSCHAVLLVTASLLLQQFLKHLVQIQDFKRRCAEKDQALRPLEQQVQQLQDDRHRIAQELEEANRDRCCALLCQGRAVPCHAVPCCGLRYVVLTVFYRLCSTGCRVQCRAVLCCVLDTLCLLLCGVNCSVVCYAMPCHAMLRYATLRYATMSYEGSPKTDYARQAAVRCLIAHTEQHAESGTALWCASQAVITSTCKHQNCFTKTYGI